jgi:phosphate transport system permease protein
MSRRRELFGQSMTALCGGALALNLLLVLALLGLIARQGLATFWPRDVERFVMRDGRVLLGEVRAEQDAPPKSGQTGRRLQLRIGNRDLNSADFLWIDQADIAERSRPRDAVLLERLEWGNIYGFMTALHVGEREIATGAAAVERQFDALHEERLRAQAAARALEQGPIGDVNREIESLRLEGKRLDRAELQPADRAAKAVALAERLASREAEYQALAERLFALRAETEKGTLIVEAADGTRKELPIAAVVRAVYPNRLGLGGKLRVYGARIWEFVAGQPRESNTEGGIFPAIFGTVMMVFLMSIAVTPLGILAALYLREYAKQGPLVRIVRVAVNNLAGVPSIVFGVFGLGFFVYIIGGSIDRLFYPEALPTPTYGTGGILWAALTLALLTVPVVIVATEEGLAAVPRVVREGSLALGATQFETLVKVVLPAAAPGLLTGLILAMARAAGEVAPLMIVGMVKLAPTLPVDGHLPFVHFERKFMHLGFHIYDVGFQSPNVDATKPLVFSTALLLIAAVTLMNLAAIALRNHLRRKYSGASV